MFLFNILFLIFIVFSLLLFFFKNNILIKIAGNILSYIVFFLILFFVTDNSDWEIYEVFFNGYADSNDFLFTYILEIVKTKGLSYVYVYQVHIVLMSIGFFYIASRKSYSDVFLIITSYLLIQLVPLSNQIRYYVAFSFFLIAVYNLIVLNKRKIFFVFVILSLLSHFAIILLYLFIYFYYVIPSSEFLKKTLSYSVILAIAFYAIFVYGLSFLEHFSVYFQDDLLSSFSGGLLSNFIWLLWFVYLFLIHRRVIKYNNSIFEKDLYYNYLFKLSFFSILFMPIGFFLQIVVHRYVISLFIIWISYILYCINLENKSKNKFHSLLVFFLFVFFTVFYIYLLPELVLGIMGTEELLRILNSNDLIKPFIL